MSSPETPIKFSIIYSRLLRYALAYWQVFIIAVIGMVLVALSQPAFAALMEPILNGGFIEKDPEVIRLVPIMVIGVFLVRAIAGFISDYGMAWIGRQIIRQLRDEMFNKLLLLPNYYYDLNLTGNTISRFTFDVEQLAQAVTTAITIIIRDVLMIVSLIGWMFYLSPKLAVVFLLLGPVIALLISMVSGRFRKISKRIQLSMGQITHILEETIQAQRVVKVFGGQQYERSRFETNNEQNRRQNMRLMATTSISTSIIQIIVAFALAGIIYAATLEGLKNNIGAGEFMSFMTAMMMLFAPLKRITNITAIMQKGVAAAESVFNLLDQEIEKDTGKDQLDRVQGDIVFANVCFAYKKDKDVLRSIKLHIKAGQTIAFVGRSGSGKTTLVNLLPRFYDAYRGNINLDNKNIRDYSLASLRDQIAYVGQDIVLFNDTVAHNIAYGRLHDVKDEDIVKAAKAAYAYDFIKDMSAGMQTRVGEKGVMLSGGQRQRIAIARALLKDAPILIMDEATSALDTESEHYIKSALEQLLKNRTTLIIAHRLSTIENADLIVVMDKGQIVETGTHQQLLQMGTHYAALHKMQFSDQDAPNRNAC
jgi:subfamily B ATP-binding cassette protein MsbA